MVEVDVAPLPVNGNTDPGLMKRRIEAFRKMSSAERADLFRRAAKLNKAMSDLQRAARKPD
jgi:hypothetical protein